MHPFGSAVHPVLLLPDWHNLLESVNEPLARLVGVASVRRADGDRHAGFAEIEPLLRERPDVLIIGTGYDNMVQVEEEILAMSAVQVLPLPTPQAVRRCNELRGEGKRVAAIIHSTC